MKSRRSRLSDPWWAITSSWPTSGEVPVASAERFTPFEVQLVEPGGQALGQAAGVDEDDGGAVLLDQLEQAGVQRRPDRAAHRAGRPPGR